MAGTSQHGKAFILPSKGAHLLIIEARFHDDLADALLDGAASALAEAGATYDVVTVPGSLEIPAVISFALDGMAEGGKAYDGFVALGTVIRGDTYHFEVVSNESARGILDVQLKTGVPIANAILTVDTEEQGHRRMAEKGRDAARAAIEMANLLKRL